MEDWKRQAEVENKYLDEESSCSEFDTISSYLDRIEKVCVDKHQNAFQAVLNPVWVAVFNEFNKYKLDDSDFEEWVKKYEKTDETFSPSQKINYMFLKNNFDSYIQRGVTA